jgi:lipid A 3-O-deacylase
MTSPFRPILTATALASLAVAAAHADESLPTAGARDAGVFTLYFENDYFGGQDQHYTNGVKLSWLSGDLSDWGQTGWRQRFADRLPFVNRTDGLKQLGFALGQNIYTPQDISRVPPDATDRPYAGWSYAEFSFISKTQSVMDTLSIQAGMVGRASQADEVQRAVHEWINSERPLGWDYQLQNEFGLNVVYERKWRWYARGFGDITGIDVIPHAGFSLGNISTYANAGFTTRLGFNLPSDFGTSLIRGGSLPNTPIDDRDYRVAGLNGGRAWSFFAFGGVDGRAVGRDIFLDGNTFRDSPSVDKEHFVGDAFYGLGIGYGRWQLTYTEVVRTREFKAQDRKSYFGSVALSRTF